MKGEKECNPSPCDQLMHIAYKYTITRFILTVILSILINQTLIDIYSYKFAEIYLLTGSKQGLCSNVLHLLSEPLIWPNFVG